MSVRRVDVIGVPMDLGSLRRGVDMGPSAVRYARLDEQLRAMGIDEIVDRGNLPVLDRAASTATAGDARYLSTILEVCDRLAGEVEDALHAGGFPLVLGGDHSIAIGTLAGIKRTTGKPPGLIWFDAHADINSPSTSPSGNVHGMPVHYALEAGSIVPERTVLIGLRDIDKGERQTIHNLGVRAYTMSDVDRYGIERVVSESLERAGAGQNKVHVSFDMDGIDPSEAPGVGTPVKGGLTFREAHLALEEIAASGKLLSLEVTEINPIFDIANRTAILAVDLILSALGKTIL